VIRPTIALDFLDGAELLQKSKYRIMQVIHRKCRLT
jgi:hypothetical protein